jgi:hypothetical protein
LVSGTAFEDALDAVSKATDQMNYSAKETNSAFAAEESHGSNRLSKEESRHVRSAEEEGWELHTEIPNLLKAVFALDFTEVLGLATLAMMTLDELPQPSALSELSSVEIFLAIIIIWVLVLAYRAKKSSPTRSADASYNDSYERS